MLVGHARQVHQFDQAFRVDGPERHVRVVTSVYAYLSWSSGLSWSSELFHSSWSSEPPNLFVLCPTRLGRRAHLTCLGRRACSVCLGHKAYPTHLGLQACLTCLGHRSRPIRLCRQANPICVDRQACLACVGRRTCPTCFCRQACPTCLRRLVCPIHLGRWAHPARLARLVVNPARWVHLWTGLNWQLYLKCLECEIQWGEIKIPPILRVFEFLLFNSLKYFKKILLNFSI